MAAQTSVFPFMTAFTSMHQDKMWAKLLLCPPACFEPAYKNWLVLVSTRTWARATTPLLVTATTLDPVEHGDVQIGRASCRERV